MYAYLALTLNPQVITNWTFSDKPLPEFKRLMAILLKRKLRYVTTIKDYKSDRDDNLILPTAVCENIREQSQVNEYSNRGEERGIYRKFVPDDNTSSLQEL